MDDIQRECCTPDHPSILSIDTTFNVGEFYVTSTTYTSKVVLNNKTGKPANLPGPAMFHTSKNRKDYLYFAHTLLENNYDLERIVFFGGDRDKAQASFLKPLKGCTFLPCKKHIEDDISRKIADLGLNATKAEILEDIFGCDKKIWRRVSLTANELKSSLRKWKVYVQSGTSWRLRLWTNHHSFQHISGNILKMT